MTAEAPRLDRRVAGRLLGVLAPWVQNPLILKELRGTLRTRRFFWAHFGTVLVLGGVLMIVCFQQSLDSTAPENIGRLLFQICVWSMGAAVVVILPSFSCTALASEREKRTFELLVTTRMTPWQIVWGKFGAAMVYAFLFLVAVLPLVQISFLFGGVSPLEVAAAFGGLLGLAAAVTAVSLGISSPFKGTRWPTSLTYAVVFFAIAPLAIAYLGNLFYNRRGFGSNWGLLAVELPAAAVAVLTSFFLILATRAVKHPADNRATALRLFFLGLAFLLPVGVLPELRAGWAGFGFRLQNEGFRILLLGTLAFLLPWILLFSCEAPVASRRSEAQAARWGRFPLVRLLAPGSARGAGFAFLVSGLLLETILIASEGLCPAVPFLARLEGLCLALSLAGFLCGAGFLLSTCLKPNMARAALFVWLGLSSSVPLCVQYFRDDAALTFSRKDLPPPAWVLPCISPGLAAASWMDRVDKGGSPVPQWRWWFGMPLDAWAGAIFATAGTAMALWGERRRRALLQRGRT